MRFLMDERMKGFFMSGGRNEIFPLKIMMIGGGLPVSPCTGGNRHA